MNPTAKIFNDIQQREAKELLSEFETFIKKKGIRLGFQETLVLAEHLLYKNNKIRTVDRAIISFRKVKK